MVYLKTTARESGDLSKLGKPLCPPPPSLKASQHPCLPSEGPPAPPPPVISRSSKNLREDRRSFPWWCWGGGGLPGRAGVGRGWLGRWD